LASLGIVMNTATIPFFQSCLARFPDRGSPALLVILVIRLPVTGEFSQSFQADLLATKNQLAERNKYRRNAIRGSGSTALYKTESLPCALAFTRYRHEQEALFAFLTSKFSTRAKVNHVIANWRITVSSLIVLALGVNPRFSRLCSRLRRLRRWNVPRASAGLPLLRYRPPSSSIDALRG